MSITLKIDTNSKTAKQLLAYLVSGRKHNKIKIACFRPDTI
jgi:hypothetical protein